MLVPKSRRISVANVVNRDELHTQDSIHRRTHGGDTWSVGTHKSRKPG